MHGRFWRAKLRSELVRTEMYSLREFGEMIADKERFRAYAQAIAESVRPGDVVAEIGSGPGVFSLLACRAGARRVFAIEADDSIEMARQLAVANGFADRIEFLQGDSRKLQLPERANIIVADIRGTVPLFSSAVESLNDARERLLAPGGRLIPRRDTLMAALVEAPEFYSRLTSPWRAADGLNLGEAKSHVLHQHHGGVFKEAELLSSSETWGVLDYAAGAPRGVACPIAFRTKRSGTAHGICLWFEATLTENIRYSSGPGGGSTIYGQLFLPWPEPVPLAEGATVTVQVRADCIGRDYVWQWNSQMALDGRQLHFRQSTMEGALFGRGSLRRHSAECRPELSEEGHAHLWLLSAMDGKMSLGEIAKEASARFPTLFPTWQQALEQAIELTTKFSR